MQQNSPQHNIIFCTFDQQPERLKSYTYLQEHHMLEQESQCPAFKICTLTHVLLAHDMALAVICSPPNTELWVLFHASACHLWWTKSQWLGHFSLYFGILLELSFHEGSISIFHSSATNTIPTQQLAAMLNRTLFLSCDFHLRHKFKSNQFTCLVVSKKWKILSHPAMSQSTNLYRLCNDKYMHADCMSVHFHSSCKPNAPIKRPKEVYLPQHGHSRNFSKSVVMGGDDDDNKANCIIHLTYMIHKSAMLYSKEPNSWYTYFQTIIQIYIKRRKLYGQHTWFWAHSFPYVTQGWNNTVICGVTK